jgi:hypothetical protein
MKSTIQNPKITLAYIGSQDTINPDVKIRLYNVITTEDEGQFPAGTTIAESSIAKNRDDFTFTFPLFSAQLIAS